MGGGGNKGPSVPDVRVPSVGELANGAISSNIENLPRLLQAFQQNAPGYSQTINDIFSQSQKRLAELYPEQYGILSKTSRNIGANLDFINQAGSSGIPEGLLGNYQNRIRSAQAARGIAESPTSAAYEATALAPVAEDYRRGVTNEALQFMNISPLMAPGSNLDLNSLGLNPISSTDLFKGNMDLSEQNISNQYNQFRLQQEAYNKAMQRKMAMGQLIGAGIGGIGGFAIGGPGGAAVGAKAGSEIGKAGGTYF